MCAHSATRSDVRGRPRETRDLVPIAREIARGVAQARIAADRGCSRTVISRRVRTMREILTRHHGDASWMGEEKTNVEVAVGYLAVAEEVRLAEFRPQGHDQ